MRTANAQRCSESALLALYFASTITFFNVDTWQAVRTDRRSMLVLLLAM
jgi:hypothetical protein